MRLLWDASDEFLDYLLYVRGYSEQTVITYRVALNQMLESANLISHDDTYTLDILPFRLNISTNHKKTITKKLSAVRSFAEYLNKQRDIPITIKGDSSIKTPQTLPKPIEEDYIAEVLSIANTQEKLLISIIYGLGLRISEVSSLRLDMIDKKWIRVDGKGGKSRQLPLLPYIHKQIDSYIRQHHPKVYLFEKGKSPMNSNQLRYIISRLFASIGIKATPHQLRHSFATDLLHHGANIADVSRLLGHSSMTTTQIYTKLATTKKLEEYTKAHPLM